MISTDKKSLLDHLSSFNIEPNANIFLHTSLYGLGLFEGGLKELHSAMVSLVPNGCIISPAFSFSWCKGNSFNVNLTNCIECGTYADFFRVQKNIQRNYQPNTSICLLDNSKDEHVSKYILKNNDPENCFGQKSAFDLMYKFSKKNPIYIILLGFLKDWPFRTPFVHYVEEKLNVPYRFVKKFYSPDNKLDFTKQLCRYNSKEEFIEINNYKPPLNYSFPINPQFNKMTKEISEEKIAQTLKFALSKTSLVRVDIFCDWLEKKIIKNKEYLFN